MATKVKAVYVGANGRGGFITDETYLLTLSRNNGSNNSRHAGLLQADYDRENSHHTKPSQAFIFESDAEFDELFDCETEFSFSEITPDTNQVAPIRAEKLTREEILKRKSVRRGLQDAEEPTEKKPSKKKKK